ncbi:hypothetical protein Tco_1556439 [Tanacetum coccineum]
MEIALVKLFLKKTSIEVLMKYVKRMNFDTIGVGGITRIETLSLDDLFNNLKAYESEVKGTSSSTTNSHNVAFLSSSSTNSKTRAVNTGQGVNTASNQGVADSSTIRNGLKMDIAMLTVRARRFLKNTERKLGHGQQFEMLGLTSPSDQAEEGPTNFALMAYSLTSSSSSTNSEVSNDSNCCSSCLECVKDLKEQNEQLVKDLRTARISAVSYKTGLESIEARLQIMDKCKTGLGYNVVPPPYIGNFMPPKHDLVYPSLDDFVEVNESVSKSIVEKPTVETNESKTARKENGTLIIED